MHLAFRGTDADQLWDYFGKSTTSDRREKNVREDVFCCRTVLLAELILQRIQVNGDRIPSP
jgi:hypothetical protein